MSDYTKIPYPQVPELHWRVFDGDAREPIFGQWWHLYRGDVNILSVREPDQAAQFELGLSLGIELGTSRADPTGAYDALRASLARLESIAEECERWASQSRMGGWSTHQVGANKALASTIREYVAAQRDKHPQLQKAKRPC